MLCVSLLRNSFFSSMMYITLVIGIVYYSHNSRSRNHINQLIFYNFQTLQHYIFCINLFRYPRIILTTFIALIIYFTKILNASSNSNSFLSIVVAVFSNFIISSHKLILLPQILTLIELVVIQLFLTSFNIASNSLVYYFHHSYLLLCYHHLLLQYYLHYCYY